VSVSLVFSLTLHGGSGQLPMSGIKLDPPEPFDFRNPEKWSQWRRRFEQYRIASGLSGESAERQACVLLYCLGKDAEDVLVSTNITDAQRKVYDSVMKKLDDHFKVRRNIIYERARFNQRTQQSGETGDEYITALYGLIENCEYSAAIKDELLRDRLVVGIRDQRLSLTLQTDSKLTLETAKKAIRQKEAVMEQQQSLKGDGSKSHPLVIDEINKRTSQSNHKKGERQPQKRNPTPKRKEETPCTRCGKGSHNKQQCPAREAECFKCHKKGHFRSQCRSKEVGSVSTEDQDDLETAYLDTITDDGQKMWTVLVAVGEHTFSFKVDTGAEVSVISDTSFRMLQGVTLQRPSKKLCGPNGTHLNVIGQFSHTMTYNNQSAEQLVFVVKGLTRNLLGLPAITDLNVVSRVDSIVDLRTEIFQSFPNLFKGLGNWGEPYEICLREDAVPFALHTPRRVPLALRDEVKAELESMEALGVISPVHEASTWCAGMVVVPKKNGKVRICVDLKPLNTAVKREVYPLPRVEETLAQLSGATTFSKLDANCGFWQIPLAESSKHLTTFITPYGRYRFNKLPFGITSAPEHFQRRMSEIRSEERRVGKEC